MSLFDDASLVYIPTGYKATNNYSGKPSTGGADMTFSRASGATRVNSKGLVEKVRTNLILQSNTFSSASWGKPNTTLTGGQPDKDGGSNAWKFEATTAGTAQLTQATGTSGIISISFYAKAGNLSIIKLWVGTGIDFDLSAGTAIGSSNASIENVGNGWFRCKYFGIYSTINPYITAASAGDYVYIQDAQVEYGTVATNYIETTSAAVSVGPVNDEPRLTYDPVNPTAPSLLMEPQRTNLIQYSEQLDNAWWVEGSAGVMSSNSTDSLDPSGYYGANKWTPNAGTAYAGFENSAVTTTIGTTYTTSFFAKANGYRYAQLVFDGGDVSGNPAANFDLQTGVVTREDSGISASIVSYGNGWYRCIGTYVAAYTSFQNNVGIQTDPNAGRAQSSTYNGTDSILFWGFQMEAGSYPTSYIPTNGTSVTRVADLSQKTGASDIIGQTEGTIYWEADFTTMVATGHEDLLNIDNGAFGNTIYLFKSSTGLFVAEIYVSSVLQASFNTSAKPIGTYKMALGYANNNAAFFVNGEQVGATDTSCSIPATSRIQLGNGALGPSTSNTKKMLLFPTRLDNATLATLTSL